MGWVGRLEIRGVAAAISVCRLPLWNREERMLQMMSEGSLSCLGEADLLVLFRTSTDQMRPSHIRKGNRFTQSSLI